MRHCTWHRHVTTGPKARPIRANGQRSVPARWTGCVGLTLQSLCLDILYGALSTHGGPFSNGLLVVWFLDRFPQFAPLRKDPREDYSVPKALLDASVSHESWKFSGVPC